MRISRYKMLAQGGRSTFVVAIVSGLAGLVMLMQDVIVASRFGASEVADAYQLAISFPMFALNVFAGGTILAVLVPLLVQFEVADQKAEAVRLIKQVRCAISWVLITACLLWVLIYPQIVGWLAKSFSINTMLLSKHLLWIVVLVLFFSGLASIDAAVLNSRKRFVFISTLPAFMPAGVILGVWLLGANLGIYAAATGLLFGSAMQLLAGRRLTRPLLHHVEYLDGAKFLLSRFWYSYGSAAASAALLGGIIITDTFVASTLPLGSTATFSYASRPVMMLLAFATAVVCNLTLPYFSHLVAVKDWDSLKKQVFFWCALLVLTTLPVIVIWYCYATEIVGLLYQRGAFGVSNTARVADLQRIYLFQIPFYLVAMIGWRAMNSLNRNMPLLIITAACFSANLIMILWLMPRLGLQGIAWGTDLAFALWAILITLYLLKICSANAAVSSGLCKENLPLEKLK